MREGRGLWSVRQEWRDEEPQAVPGGGAVADAADRDVAGAGDGVSVGGGAEPMRLVTAALNLPGFLMSYVLAYRRHGPMLPLIAAGDVVFWVPAIYAVLRWGEWVRVRRRGAR